MCTLKFLQHSRFFCLLIYRIDRDLLKAQLTSVSLQLTDTISSNSSLDMTDEESLRSLRYSVSLCSYLLSWKTDSRDSRLFAREISNSQTVRKGLKLTRGSLYIVRFIMNSRPSSRLLGWAGWGVPGLPSSQTVEVIVSTFLITFNSASFTGQ